MIPFTYQGEKDYNSYDETVAFAFAEPFAFAPPFPAPLGLAYGAIAVVVALLDTLPVAGPYLAAGGPFGFGWGGGR